jgi:hypothetical protein
MENNVPRMHRRLHQPGTEKWFYSWWSKWYEILMNLPLHEREKAKRVGSIIDKIRSQTGK